MRLGVRASMDGDQVHMSRAPKLFLDRAARTYLAQIASRGAAKGQCVETKNRTDPNLAPGHHVQQDPPN